MIQNQTLTGGNLPNANLLARRMAVNSDMTTISKNSEFLFRQHLHELPIGV